MPLDWYAILLFFAIVLLCFAVLGLLRAIRPGRFALLLVLAISLLHQLIYRTVAEDAYIAFRYARNAAQGYGFVFNPGERVEGYSDFLWTASLSFLHRLFGLDLPRTASTMGVVFVLVGVLLTWRLAMKLTSNGALAVVAALIVASSSTYSAYGPSGLEGPLFSAVVLMLLLAIYSDHFLIAGLLLGLGVMTRPDGILLVVPIAVAVLLTPGLTAATRLKKIMLAGGSALLLGIPWTLWRVAFYGYLIPNAVAAKRGMNFVHQISDGTWYLARFCIVHLPLVAAVLILAIPAVRRADQASRSFAAAAATAMFAAVYASFVLLAGGDWMPGYRFLGPVVPPLAVLLVYLISENPPIFNALTGWRVRGVLTAACAFMVGVSSVLLVPKFRAWDQQTKGLGEIGIWLHDSVPKTVTTACFACGALPYFSELATLDMLGLADEHIARHGLRKPFGAPGHIAYDYDYVVSRKPQIIAFMSGQGFERRPESPVDTGTQRWHDYDVVSFHFVDSKDRLDQYVTLLVLRSEKDRLVPLLLRPGKIEIVPGPIKVWDTPVAFMPRLFQFADLLTSSRSASQASRS